MMSNKTYDAIVVGSGPNGLAAGIKLAQAGLSVIIYEAKDTIGGGMRSAELTLPGFIHDICSAIHPLGISSPFFCKLPLDQHGLKWIQPVAPLAHPFEDGKLVLLEHSIDETCLTLKGDSGAYKRLIEPLVSHWDKLEKDLLSPLHFPKHPFALMHFGIKAIRSASNLAKSQFKDKYARGLFAGLAAHSMMPLNKPLTAAFGLILGVLGHTKGWPMPLGGSQNLANALASYFRSIGGEIITGKAIESFDQLTHGRVVFFDVTPRQLLRISGNSFPLKYRHKLKKYRYGPGVFKIDWALNEPIPWKDKKCARAGTVHLGGTLEEIEKSEREVWEGKPPTAPFVLLAQQSLFDQTRAPKGKHTAWGYCHLPNDSNFDMTERIESQIEKFAPGFRECILSRSCKDPLELEEYNPNYIGGDINGGVQDLYQLFTRPVARIVPYSTPLKNIYICSSSTPPGGGVHGMCGYHAAKAALKKCF